MSSVLSLSEKSDAFLGIFQIWNVTDQTYSLLTKSAQTYSYESLLLNSIYFMFLRIFFFNVT